VVGVILCLIEALQQRDSIRPRPRIFRWRATGGTPSGWHDTTILVAADACLVDKSVSDAAWDWFKWATTSRETVFGTIAKSSPSRRDSQAARPGCYRLKRRYWASSRGGEA
jgi:hypothetical protein